MSIATAYRNLLTRAVKAGNAGTSQLKDDWKPFRGTAITQAENTITFHVNIEDADVKELTQRNQDPSTLVAGLIQRELLADPEWLQTTLQSLTNKK